MLHSLCHDCKVIAVALQSPYITSVAKTVICTNIPELLTTRSGSRRLHPRPARHRMRWQRLRRCAQCPRRAPTWPAGWWSRVVSADGRAGLAHAARGGSVGCCALLRGAADRRVAVAYGTHCCCCCCCSCCWFCCAKAGRPHSTDND